MFSLITIILGIIICCIAPWKKMSGEMSEHTMGVAVLVFLGPILIIVGIAALG